MDVNSQFGQVFCPLFATVNYSAASQEQALFFQIPLFGEIWRSKAKISFAERNPHSEHQFLPVWSLHT